MEKTKPSQSTLQREKARKTTQTKSQTLGLSVGIETWCVSPLTVQGTKSGRDLYPCSAVFKTSCHTDEESQYTDMCTALPRQIFVAGIGPCLAAALTSKRSFCLPQLFKKTLWASSSQSQGWTLLNASHCAPTPRLCNFEILALNIRQLFSVSI